MNSELLIEMLIDIEYSLSTGTYLPDLHKYSKGELKVFNEIKREVRALRQGGLSVEIPAEWPELVDTGLRQN